MHPRFEWALRLLSYRLPSHVIFNLLQEIKYVTQEYFRNFLQPFIICSLVLFNVL